MQVIVYTNVFDLCLWEVAKTDKPKLWTMPFLFIIFKAAGLIHPDIWKKMPYFALFTFHI